MSLISVKLPGRRAHTLPSSTTRPEAKRQKRPVMAVLSAGWLALVVVAVATRPLLGLPNPATIDYANIAVGPFSSGSHLLGTDLLGRDILARLISGAQVSLSVGIGAVAVSIVLGGTLGIVAGFLGGWVDRLIGIMTDVLLAFPPLVATIVLAVFLGSSLKTLVLAIGIVFTPQLARVARSAALTYARREFVVAARGTGATSLRVLTREVLPNTVGPVLAYGAVMVAVGIVAEAGISFLGLGVPPPQSSWGSMMGDDRSALTNSPHAILLPALAMALTLLAVNFLSEYVGRRFEIREAVL
ncbi:ABC transporter permease [Streptomyces sp. NPDC005507]|uniref:ABC transporter permease n=1 Tax=unclassified Streptomyces TaxID=2593676 RepID=UPI0033BC9C88